MLFTLVRDEFSFTLWSSLSGEKKSQHPDLVVIPPSFGLLLFFHLFIFLCFFVNTNDCKNALQLTCFCFFFCLVTVRQSSVKPLNTARFVVINAMFIYTSGFSKLDCAIKCPRKSEFQVGMSEEKSKQFSVQGVHKQICLAQFSTLTQSCEFDVYELLALFYGAI